MKKDTPWSIGVSFLINPGRGAPLPEASQYTFSRGGRKQPGIFLAVQLVFRKKPFSILVFSLQIHETDGTEYEPDKNDS
jgi:hypothetical protein